MPHENFRIIPLTDRHRWQLLYWQDVHGKRRRFRPSFPTKFAAEKRRRELLDEISLVGAIWSSLTPGERAELMLIAGQIHAAGHTLKHVWDTFRAGANPLPAPKIPIAKALKQFIADKYSQNFRRSYVESLEQYLDQFARGRESLPVTAITTTIIQNWRTSRAQVESLKTWSSNLGRLSSFFQYCWRQHWIAENPCARVSRPKLDRHPPRILTPIQILRLLAGTPNRAPQMMAWLICGLYAGLRPEETMFENPEEKSKAVGWTQIDLKRKTITVTLTSTKIRHPRIVPLEPVAVKWLKFAKQIGAPLPISNQQKKRGLKKLRRLIHAKKWPPDILRHTAASLLLAKYQDMARVAKMLGTSPRELARSYENPIFKKTALKLLAIMPRTVK